TLAPANACKAIHSIVYLCTTYPCLLLLHECINTASRECQMPAGQRGSRPIRSFIPSQDSRRRRPSCVSFVVSPPPCSSSPLCNSDHVIHKIGTKNKRGRVKGSIRD
ncbi:hypothetical protein CCMA1212_009256, partial [Trichoderma ghanense]